MVLLRAHTHTYSHFIFSHIQAGAHILFTAHSLLSMSNVYFLIYAQCKFFLLIQTRARTHSG